MTVHDDAAAQAPAPTASKVPSVRDLLASCAAARTVSTPPSDDAEPSDPSAAPAE